MAESQPLHDLYLGRQYDLEGFELRMGLYHVLLMFFFSVAFRVIVCSSIFHTSHLVSPVIRLRF
jgi:hypothetical protein